VWSRARWSRKSNRRRTQSRATHSRTVTCSRTKGRVSRRSRRRDVLLPVKGVRVGLPVPARVAVLHRVRAPFTYGRVARPDSRWPTGKRGPERSSLGRTSLAGCSRNAPAGGAGGGTSSSPSKACGWDYQCPQESPCCTVGRLASGDRSAVALAVRALRVAAGQARDSGRAVLQQEEQAAGRPPPRQRRAGGITSARKSRRAAPSTA
jgi:hypothetical protein